MDTARASDNPQFAINVEKLEQVQPKDLTATEISVRVGASWIDQNTGFLAAYPFFIEYPHVPLVQRGLKKLIGVDALGAVGSVDTDVIPAVLVLSLDPPLAGGIGTTELNLLNTSPATSG